MLQVARFAAHAAAQRNTKNPSAVFAAERDLLSHICANSRSLFSSEVRLFPLGFTKLDSEKHENEASLLRLLQEYEKDLCAVREKLERLLDAENWDETCV